MTALAKQHLIDPEICIRCYTCEATCPIQAIEHNDDNVVVDFDKCDHCMACIPVCPTGSIDEWRVVATPYSLDEQYAFEELPEQADVGVDEAATSIEALDEAMATLLAEAHAGAGGKAKAPATASKPTINLYNLGKPAEATVQGNYRLTAENADSDVRHIILDFGAQPMPILEGQSLGIIAPGSAGDGQPHLPRLYSVSSPRDGERPNFNNLSLTVKREAGGLCSNYLCDLKKGDRVKVSGPFGATFLLPSDPAAKLLLICTGTGSAPFRAFTMRRQRAVPGGDPMVMYFGARTPESLPYFGPLKKVPPNLLIQHLVFSRQPGEPKEYVQDRVVKHEEQWSQWLGDPNLYIYVCGLRGMEQGLERAFTTVAKSAGLSWQSLRDDMRDDGRYHVETY